MRVLYLQSLKVGYNVARTLTHKHSADADSSGAPAVTRAAAILRLLARHDEPLGVNSIAKELNLVPSTCLHILRALAAESFVYVDPASKLYSLDAGLLPLAQKIMRQDDFGQRVVPFLESFATDFGVTAVGVRVTGLRHMVVLALSQPNVAFRLYVEIGSHFPALISATGRCCAAFGHHDPKAIKGAFSELHWDRPPTLKDWLAEVEDAKKAGFSIDNGRYLRGITVVAAPVFNRNGQMSHALTTVGLSERLDKTIVQKMGNALKQAGLELSHGQPANS